MIGIAALTAGAGGAALVSGCGSAATKSTPAATHGAPPARAGPPPASHSAPAPRRGRRSRGVGASSRPARVFSGTGTRRLGTLKLARTSVIVWRAQGSGLRVRDSRTKLIQATGPGTGATVVAAGVHRAVLVTASGRWRLEIRAL